MVRILTIVGARPQFIKAAAVSRKIEESQGIEEIIVHTGQHFDINMSEVFFEEMDIPKPKYFLDINSLTHGAMTGRMIEKIEEIIIKECPDWVMVYGDTNSTLAGALAAKKLHVKVAHIEAGLRSHNNFMPEEINRILTDRISDLLFCTSNAAIDNLTKEGFSNFQSKMVLAGDVMYDALLYYIGKSKEVFPVSNGKFALATLHREENTNNPEILEQLVQAINYINNEVIPIVIPLHPRTKKKLAENNFKLDAQIIPPASYLEMISLLNSCSLVITDSGGLQKEAYFCRKTCVTLRNETEWTELVDYNYNFLAGNNNANRIIETVQSALGKKNNVEKTNLYGKGNAVKVIVEHFLNH